MIKFLKSKMKIIIKTESLALIKNTQWLDMYLKLCFNHLKNKESKILCGHGPGLHHKYNTEKVFYLFIFN